jgi:hypothetical protein
MVLILVSLIVGVFSALPAASSSSEVGSDFVKATTTQALRSIKNAESAGAESGSYSSCVSYYDCIIQSNNIMLAIVEESSQAGKVSTAETEQVDVMMFTVYLPLGSFAMSLTIVALYRAWKAHRTKSYAEMDIHQRRQH